MKIGVLRILDILKGGSFFACGGGVPVSKSGVQVASMRSDCCIQLRALPEFEADDILCTVYAIGAAGASQKQYSALLKAFDALEDHLEVTIAGVVPGEIGSEINAIWVAAHRDVALVDSDMVGGRAVPEDQMDMHAIHGVPTAPTVALNGRGDVFLASTVSNPGVFESVFRSFAVASDGYCYLAGRPVKRESAETFLPANTVSKALRLGEAIAGCSTPLELINVTKEVASSVLLCQGNVISIEEERQPGFLSGYIHVEGVGEFLGRLFKLYFKNENIILHEGTKCLCSVPDLITLVSVEALEPIHNAELLSGTEVLVFGTPALDVWKEPKALETLEPRCFGFSDHYEPIGSASAKV